MFSNTPIQAFSINGVTNLGFYGVDLDNSLGDTEGGHNTDAFDIGSSTGVYISGAIVKYQDDCLAVNSGTNITFIGRSCSGGHGLSIGSVGGRSDNVVKSVRILTSKISDSDNGVRIKTISGVTGSVSDIKYDSIALSDIAKYGIIIEQDYENGSHTSTRTSGVPITGIYMNNVSGSAKSSGINIFLLCASLMQELDMDWKQGHWRQDLQQVQGYSRRHFFSTRRVRHAGADGWNRAKLAFVEQCQMTQIRKMGIS
ncbi:hypothetical protein BFJ72_g15157 [Fusarium proliferatum]|uniref:Polygalacturonase n=1 Tax=Gibberella intermedia TaxID=948311 RepID=A0A420RRB9_GIBIN|nr:hypothetical protein BFJ72_g15157 [Fusarium proliferatum]